MREFYVVNKSVIKVYIMKTRLKKLQDLFDFIDENYGCGPQEEIIDENKVDEYIENFINDFKDYKIFKRFSVLNEDTNKTILESLNEI